MSLNSTYGKMARPLGVRGHQKRSFLVASYKTNGEMFVESANEHTTMLALDIDPRTRSIIPQPFTVRLDLGMKFSTRREALRCEPSVPMNVVSGQPGEERIYTPDFEVGLMMPIPLIVESKSSFEMSQIAPALERRERILNNLGYHYVVVSSTQVEHKGLHSNLVNLRDAMQFRRKNATESLLESLTNLVANRPSPFAFGEIRSQTSALALYVGLVSGVIACDLRSGHFGNDTKIWQAYGDLTHLQILRMEA